MWAQIAQREGGAPGVTRRVVRLLVLLGVMVAAYLVLSLFDHAARADGVSADQIGATDPVTLKVKADGAKRAVPEPKSVLRNTAPSKTHSQKIHRSTIKVPKIHPSKVQAPKKIQARKKIHAPSIQAAKTVRRVQVRTSKLRQPTSDVVGTAVRATVTHARTAVTQLKLSTPTQLPSLSEQVKQVELPPPGLPAPPPPWSPQLPGLPQAQLPTLPQPQGPPQVLTPVLSPPTASPSAPAPLPATRAQVSPLSQTVAFAPASGLSDVTKPPAAQTQPRTAPRPAGPEQPANHPASTGQARDAGGGNAPAMGTVSSSWRPEVAAAGRRLATDLLARGRTVRHAGPPS
jgi:hypothetical protein